MNPANRPRLLVTGGSSSLGRVIVAQAAAKWQVLACYWEHPELVRNTDALAVQIERVDLCEPEEVDLCIRAFEPDAIIHTAGSNRSADMERLIETGARCVASSAREIGARLVHISTDVIFDGTAAPYKEADTPRPLHAYGRAKARAEQIVLQTTPNAVVIRTSLIYSLTGADHTSQWLLEAARAGQPVTLFIDEIRCPVWAETLAAACLELSKADYTGILHVAGDQAVSRWDLGVKLLALHGVLPGPTIRPGQTPINLRAERPQDCRLNIELAKSILTTPLPGLAQVLAGGRQAGRSPRQDS